MNTDKPPGTGERGLAEGGERKDSGQPAGGQNSPGRDRPSLADDPRNSLGSDKLERGTKLENPGMGGGGGGGGGNAPVKWEAKVETPEERAQRDQQVVDQANRGAAEHKMRMERLARRGRG